MASAEGGDSPVAGIVKHLQSPVPGALVFVYGVSDSTLTRATTKPDGSFHLESIPAGVYDVIAYKTGFYPSLVRLWHQATPAVSTLAIDLVASLPASVRKGPVDVWSWRDRLPSDVLREITAEAPARDPSRPTVADRVNLGRAVAGDFSSSTEIGQGASNFSRTDVNFYGSAADAIQYGFRGSYDSLTGDGSSPLSRGTSKDASLLLAGSPDSGVALTYAGRGFGRTSSAPASRLDREALLVNHRTDNGDRYEGSISRRTETGFERATSPLGDRLPASSNSYEARGSWSRSTDEAQGGVTVEVWRRDWEKVSPAEEGARAASLDASVSASGEKSLGTLSIGGLFRGRVGDSGGFLAPGASLRIQLSPVTSILVAASRSVTRSDSTVASSPRAVSAGSWNAASNSEASAALTFGTEDSGRILLKATSQSTVEPLRLYFDGDLFLDLGSLYLFDGNRLEKVSGVASRRLGTLFDASMSAEVGRVAGNVSSDAHQALSVISDRGQYYSGEAGITLRPTRTDLSCGVRHVRQVLIGDAGRTNNFSDKLRLSLGQDLTVLGFDPFGTAWKLVVSYETDTNALPVDNGVEEVAVLKRRVMGGLAISF